MIFAGVVLALGLVFGRSDFNLETDSADLLDLESTDLMLLTTFEYDLVMGLVSLISVGSGALMMEDEGCKKGMEGWMEVGRSSTPK